MSIKRITIRALPHTLFEDELAKIWDKVISFATSASKILEEVYGIEFVDVPYGDVFDTSYIFYLSPIDPGRSYDKEALNSYVVVRNDGLLTLDYSKDISNKIKDHWREQEFSKGITLESLEKFGVQTAVERFSVVGKGSMHGSWKVWNTKEAGYLLVAPSFYFSNLTEEARQMVRAVKDIYSYTAITQ